MPDDIAKSLSHDLWLLVPTAIYFVAGLSFFLFSIWLIVKLCPFSVRKEIEEDQNIALAIIIAAVLIGIATIIASVIVSG